MIRAYDEHDLTMVRYRFWDNSSERKLTSLDPVTTVAYKVGQYGQ